MIRMPKIKIFLFLLFILVIVNGCVEMSSINHEKRIQIQIDSLPAEAFSCRTVEDCSKLDTCCGSVVAINKNYAFKIDCNYDCPYITESCQDNLACENNKCVIKYQC